ncbi:exonuclease vii small subunit [Trichococcus palustris]|jgi:exodeoxyribonuclease VII small subunit|uniref:Exodeoxyribonuclease 7 small subunit n=1 Tax=Trichococcus palustris TaxID=140314 RepID=A0A143YF58_9LACT|nr:exodeoxyribonuclease VII small subunit [Trichococcus palustris]CZQ87438.1 exonuclease vii small subunit [Trichococcus palustris]SFK78912.1 Exodeoxyribonuclease VII small subunit [Trichococcus palustris]
MTQSKNKLSFEEAMTQLEAIVTKLESGDVPLEEALEQFKAGMSLSKYCQDTLNNAEKTLTKIVAPNGDEISFEEDKPETEGE